MAGRKIIAVITNVFGDRVIVGDAEIKHAIEQHFETLPLDILLELIERVFKDPTVVYEERSPHTYHLFYRLENGRYLVAVIKKSSAGSFFASIYPTGKTIRNKHRNLKKVKL